MLSPQQDAVLQAVAAFLRDPARQVSYLGGFAGAGKTPLARTLADDADKTMLFASIMRQAASKSGSVPMRLARGAPPWFGNCRPSCRSPVSKESFGRLRDRSRRLRSFP